MFCEHCGKQLKDGSKFCEFCGKPVNVPAQPAPQAPAQPAPQVPAQPAPKAPKKPMSKGAKMGILFGSIGAVVVAVALIIVFTVVLPSLNVVDASKYIDVKFNQDDLYDGYLSGQIKIDEDAIFNEYLADKAKNDSSYYYSSSDLRSLILSYCKVSVTKDGDKDQNKEESSYLTGAKEIKDVSSKDVYTVNLSWTKTTEGQAELQNYENRMGIKFDKKDATLKVKISDELKKDQIKVKETTVIDPLGYIADKKLVYTQGMKNGSLRLVLKESKTTLDGVKVTIGGNYDGINFEDASGESYRTSYGFSDSNSNKYNGSLSDGDKLTLNINSYSYGEQDENVRLGKTGIVLKETKKQYTAKCNKPLTKAQAKKYSSKLLKAINENSSEKVKASAVFILNNKKSDAYYQNMYYVIYKSKEHKSYYGYYLTNVYVQDGEVIYGSSYRDSIWGGSTVNKAIKSAYYLRNSDYKRIRVK